MSHTLSGSGYLLQTLKIEVKAAKDIFFIFQYVK